MRTISEHKVRQGDSYSVTVNKSIAAGGTLNLVLKNPSNSGVRAVITNIRITSPDGKLNINVPFGFTVDSDGSSVNIDNRALGDSKTTSLSAFQDGTYSSVDHTATTYIGTGTGGAGTVFGSISDNVSGVMLQDEYLIIELSNPSGSNSRAGSITVTYYETSARDVGETT